MLDFHENVKTFSMSNHVFLLQKSKHWASQYRSFFFKYHLSKYIFFIFTLEFKYLSTEKIKKNQHFMQSIGYNLIYNCLNIYDYIFYFYYCCVLKKIE